MCQKRFGRGMHYVSGLRGCVLSIQRCDRYLSATRPTDRDAPRSIANVTSITPQARCVPRNLLIAIFNAASASIALVECSLRYLLSIYY